MRIMFGQMAWPNHLGARTASFLAMGLAIFLGLSLGCTPINTEPPASRPNMPSELGQLRSVSANAAEGNSASLPSSGQLLVEDLDNWALDLGLWPIRQTSQRKVKIAILDNGFAGAAQQIGRSLPARTQLRPGPVAVDPKTEDVHGTKMAEILAGLLDRGGVDYELHLFSAFGYSNLKAATETVVREGFHLVLYAQVWEYGGNGDGRGFINALVTPVVNAGILWINAAGNFDQLMYRGRVERAYDDWAKLPSPNQSVRVRCDRTPTGKCPLRAVLAWNDFKDDVRAGTTKDLDLVLTDDTTRVLQTAGLRQRQDGEATPGTSLYPREILEAELTPGLYHLRVKLRSTDWSERDALRISLQGDGLRLLDATAGESLLAPADHPDVLVIGAQDSDRSSVSQLLGRPDLSLRSLIRTESGQAYKGSSNAAAAAAARWAGLMSKMNLHAAWPQTRSEALALWTRAGRPEDATVSRPTPPSRPANFGPTHPMGCYQLITLQTRLSFLDLFFQAGGQYVATTLGPKLLVPADPWQLLAQAGVSVAGQGEMLIAHKTGLQRLPLGRRAELPGDVLEIAQAPRHMRICRF